MSSHGIVDRSSLLFAGGLLLLRAFDARHVGQASLGTFCFAMPMISNAAWRFCDGWPKAVVLHQQFFSQLLELIWDLCG